MLNADEQSFEEIVDSWKGIPIEKQRRLFYVLDYVLNYHTGDRHLWKPLEEKFAEELEYLKNKNLILTKTMKDRYMGSYEKLEINENFLNQIKGLLVQKYYPMFSEKEVSETINTLIQKIGLRDSLDALLTFKEIISDYMYYSAGSSRRPLDLNSEGYSRISGGFKEKYGFSKFLKSLCEKELAFHIVYVNSKKESKDCFILRYEPIDIASILINIADTKISSFLKKLGDLERLCLYVKWVYPEADLKFFVKNLLKLYTPKQIEDAYASLGDLNHPKQRLNDEMIRGVIQDVESDEKERIHDNLIRFLIDDQKCAIFMGAIIALASDKGRYLELRHSSLTEIKQHIGDFERLSTYINAFNGRRLIYFSYQDDLIVPKIVLDKYSEIVKPKVDEVIIFEDEEKGKEFLEKEFSRAEEGIDIWDPYLEESVLKQLEKICKSKPSLKIRILTTNEKLQKDLKTANKKWSNIEAVVILPKEFRKPNGSVGYKRAFHDRYLIIDRNRVWHLGHSLDELGKKPYTSASRFPEKEARMISDAFEFNFDKKLDVLKEKGDWDAIRILNADHKVIARKNFE